MVHRTRKVAFVAVVACLASVCLASGRSLARQDKVDDWGKVDRAKAVEMALRILDKTAELSGDTAAAGSLRAGRYKIKPIYVRDRLFGVELTVHEWSFTFLPKDGSLQSATRPYPQKRGERVLTLDELKSRAMEYLKLAELPGHPLELSAGEEDYADKLPVVTMLVRAYHNGLWATLQPQIGLAIDDGRLYYFAVRTELDFDTLSKVPRQPLEKCRAAAIDAYLRCNPYRNTALVEPAGVIGAPMRFEFTPSEITEEQQRLFDRGLGIPMYRFHFGDADYLIDGQSPPGVYVPRQVVHVDMMTGRAMTVFDGGTPLGGARAKLRPFAKRLDRLGVLALANGRGAGKAKASGAPQTKEPSGRSVYLRSDKTIIRAVLDSKGRLWTFDGKQWHGFQPDAALAKAVKAEAARKMRPFGARRDLKKDGS